MERFFNTAGPCNPANHYMLPWEHRLPGVRDLMDQQLYFVVHAPRQVGKTTSFRHLARALTAEGKYAALLASCETGQTARSDIKAGVMGIVRSIEANARQDLPDELRPPPADLDQIEGESRLAVYLEQWTRACPRPLVLFLDEIDALLDESLLSVLRQLRAGYFNRPEGFPHSMALIGLRDVRDYKMKVRPEQESAGTASPFNVKVRSIRLRDFNAEEVDELYRQHTAETGQKWTDEAVARAFELSQGQPWLVNALAYQICSTDLRDRTQVIGVEHIEQAKETLIERRDTHLDSLVARLNEPRVRRVIEPILTGDVSFDPTFNDDFSFVHDLGLVAQREGAMVIANPIYAEIIPRILSFHVQMGIYLQPQWFVAEDGTLDMMKLIGKFLEFWQENGEVLLKGMPYQEAAPHLVFMAYLQRVVNHGGRIAREFAVGTKRADLVVDFGGRKDVIELKLASASRALQRGLEQVAAYSKRLGRDGGYLIIFDPASDTPWEERGAVEAVVYEGVTVTVVRA
ncbi:MAG: AAA-like domain-containing protein [Actinobacteria bacterium]|nr:AAA-like domain-containing protein [Actinomycetota bacterium]